MGRPDELKGQGVVAFVTLRDRLDRQQGTRRETSHSTSATSSAPSPSRTKSASPTLCPKTRSGKIMRRLLKQIASGATVTGDTTTLEDFSVLAKLKQSDE